MHLMEILCKLGSQPGNLLLHDGHTRPDLVDPPGLAGDMASGRPEAVLQQEIRNPGDLNADGGDGGGAESHCNYTFRDWFETLVR